MKRLKDKKIINFKTTDSRDFGRLNLAEFEIVTLPEPAITFMTPAGRGHPLVDTLFVYDDVSGWGVYLGYAPRAKLRDYLTRGSTNKTIIREIILEGIQRTPRAEPYVNNIINKYFKEDQNV